MRIPGTRARGWAPAASSSADRAEQDGCTPVREFPPDALRRRFVRRALRAAVLDVILPAFAEQCWPRRPPVCR